MLFVPELQDHINHLKLTDENSTLDKFWNKSEINPLFHFN